MCNCKLQLIVNVWGSPKHVLVIWWNLDNSLIHVRRTGAQCHFRWLWVLVLWSSFIRGNMRRGNEETQSGGCLLCASAVKGRWRTHQREEKEGGGGGRWRKQVREVVQHCPHVRRSTWLECCSSASLILFWQPCVYQQRAITCIFLVQHLRGGAVPFYE